MTTGVLLFAQAFANGGPAFSIEALANSSSALVRICKELETGTKGGFSEV
jgi:hypothetical protein